MRKLLLIIFIFGFCYAQDSTAIQLSIDKQIELRNTVQEQVMTVQEQVMQGQIDLGKIDYALWVLNEMLKPPKEEEKDEE